MSIAALSSAGFSQYVTSSSNINATQQALQSLQQSLASGDLAAAQTAFNTYQTLTQNLANASGTSTNSQFSTDLKALGTAISSGDLATAQSAFTAVQNDAKATSAPAVAAALTAVSQTVSEVEDLLSIFNTSSSTTDSSSSILGAAYGQSTSSSTTDPTTSLLESEYGGSSANTASTPASSVDLYA